MDPRIVFCVFITVVVVVAQDDVRNDAVMKRGWGSKFKKVGRAVSSIADHGLHMAGGRGGRGSQLLNSAIRQLNNDDYNSYNTRRRSYDRGDILQLLRRDNDPSSYDNFDPRDDSEEYYDDVPYKRSSNGNCGIRSKMTSSEKRESLELHNTLRAQERAADMTKLTYSDELADRAQQLAETCVWEHGLLETCDGEGLGQNMYISSATDGFPDLDLGKAIEGWYNEKEDYDYNSDHCTPGKMCGHYTQLAWAKSTEVGCGVTRCPVVRMSSGTWKNALFFVCDYAPVGNWIGQKPFQKGQSCSQCDWNSGFGTKCDNGLCAKCTVGRESGCACQYSSQCNGNGSFDTRKCSCKCNRGFYGNECEESCACEDEPGYDQACPQWTANCADPMYKNFLLQYCKKTCNFCSAPEGVC